MIIPAVIVMSVPHKVMNIQGLSWWQGCDMMLGLLITDRCGASTLIEAERTAEWW